MEEREKNTKNLQSLQGNPVAHTADTSLEISLDAWKKTIALANLSQIQNEWKTIEKNTETLWSYFVLIPFEHQIEMLSYISHDVQVQLFSEILSPDVLLKYYTEQEIGTLSSAIDTKVHEQIFYTQSNNTDAHNRSSFTLGFTGEDAEGIMTSKHALTISPHKTAEETLTHIEKNIDSAETIYYVYVVDDQGKLEGVILLRDLIRQKKMTRVQDFMVKNVYSVQKHSCCHPTRE